MLVCMLITSFLFCGLFSFNITLYFVAFHFELRISWLFFSGCWNCCLIGMCWNSCGEHVKPRSDWLLERKRVESITTSDEQTRQHWRADSSARWAWLRTNSALQHSTRNDGRHAHHVSWEQAPMWWRTGPVGRLRCVTADCYCDFQGSPEWVLHFC